MNNKGNIIDRYFVSVSSREPLCQAVKEPAIYLDQVKPSGAGGEGCVAVPLPPSPGTFLDNHEDYADIWLPAGTTSTAATTIPGSDDGGISSGYRTLSGDTGNMTSCSRQESVSIGSCVLHGNTSSMATTAGATVGTPSSVGGALSDCTSPPILRVSTRSSCPSPRQVYRGPVVSGEIGGNKDHTGNMYSYGALEPGWGIWREQQQTTTGEDGQKTTSILV